MPRTIPAPSVQGLLDRMNSTIETLDTVGCAVADSQIEAGPHIGRTMITLAATLAENLMAIEAVLTKAKVMDSPCPTPYLGEASGE